MVGLSSYSSSNLLAYLTGRAAMPALAGTYLALLTAVGSDGGSGFIEPAGGNYSRIAASGASVWNAPAGLSPSTASNSAALAFPAATGAWGSVIAFALFDSLTGGNLLLWDYLGAAPWLPFACSAASPGLFTSPAHGYTAGAQVVLTTEFGGTLPGTAGSLAGLLTVAGPTADTFNVGVNTTTAGDGMVRLVSPQTVAAGATATFAGGAPGALVLAVA